MKPGDCFLMKGATKEKPMTIYLIDDFKGEKLYAYALYVGDNMIQGLDYPMQYDNNIPPDAVILPKDTYSKAKELMKAFVKEAHCYIRENIIGGDVVIEMGKRYYDYRVAINVVKKIKEGRVYYETFRIDEENISPYWKGEANIDVLIDSWRPIPEYVYQEILSRYKRLLRNLREYMFNPLVELI